MGNGAEPPRFPGAKTWFGDPDHAPTPDAV